MVILIPGARKRTQELAPARRQRISDSGFRDFHNHPLSKIQIKGSLRLRSAQAFGSVSRAEERAGLSSAQDVNCFSVDASANKSIELRSFNTKSPGSHFQSLGISDSSI